MSHKNCSQCHRLMVCDSTQLGCWCMSLPNIIPVSFNQTSDCVCQTCLIGQINDVLSSHYETYTIEELLYFASQYKTPPTMLAGLDYQMVQDIKVYSKWHWLKQGQCCAENCNNCPY